MSQHVLVIGCGDLGLRIAERHRAAGDVVTGLVRRPEQAAALRSAGLEAVEVDLDQPWAAPAADLVYWCAPPPAQGREEPRLAHALRTLVPPSGGFLYVSTTGVYGDCAGRWIDEAEPLKPASERGLRRFDAELRLRAWAARSGAKTVTLRVPGIYGPGRLPVARLQSGAPILQAMDCPFSNRIHIDDLAAAAVLALSRGVGGGAYNVSDGEPSTMSDYFLRCAAALDLPAPPQVSMAIAKASFSPMLLSYLEESKRMAPTRLRALGFEPRFASLDEGLQQCLAVARGR